MSTPRSGGAGVARVLRAMAGIALLVVALVLLLCTGCFGFLAFGELSRLGLASAGVVKSLIATLVGAALTWAAVRIAIVLLKRRDAA